MTFEELQKANATIKTVDIKGKQYAEVNQRIKAFRMLYPDGFIRTEMIYNGDGMCIIRAEVGVGDKVLGTGMAFEERGSSFINKTSYIENCETSSVGRAIGMLGIGIDTSVASYEEVANAIKQQESDEVKELGKQKIGKNKQDTILSMAERDGVDIPLLLGMCKVKAISDITENVFVNITTHWEDVKKKCPKPDEVFK